MAILTQTFPAAPGGSNLALPAHELDDTEARLLQDILVDYPALARRRGPVLGVSGLVAQTHKASGFVSTLDPLGQDRYGILNGDNTDGYFSIFDPSFASKVDLAWPYRLPNSPATDADQAYRHVDNKPALGGGTMIGVSDAYDANAPEQGLALWRGGYRANSAALTVTVARGSADVTGTGFTANVSPGMWMFADTDEPYTDTLVGCVLQVNSNTSLTLTSVSPYAITAKDATFQALRGIAPRVTKGRITADTTSTAVNGGGTKFVAQGLASGSWQLYKQTDLTFIGKVSTVASETSLTLTANAAVAVVDEAYVAIKADADYSIINTASVHKVGWLNAVYAERQWYGNIGAQYQKTSRLWFSDVGDPEALDLTNDGDWIDITSTSMVNEPIRGLIPAYNSLLVLKENEAFAVFGSSPDSFSVRKVHDDGTLGGMSIQPYGGGAIWAGREGIHYFDGIQVQNLTALKLGDVWKNSIRSFDPNRYRMYSMIIRNHYYLFVEDLDPTVAIVKGNVSTTPSHWGIMLNMTTRAITFFTNLKIRGAVVLPASAGEQVWYVVNDSTKGVVCDADTLFDSEGVDAFGCDGGTPGPDYFFESKKFDAGDALRLKRFKALLVHYLAQGGDIKIDTVLGLNNIGTTLTATFPESVYTWDTFRAALSTWDAAKNEFATWAEVVSSVFVPKRVRFTKKSQHFHFRLYQENAAMTRLQVGPYQVGFKLMRPGRV